MESVQSMLCNFTDADWYMMIERLFNVIATGPFQARGRTDQKKYHVSYSVICLGWFELLPWSPEVEAMANGDQEVLKYLGVKLALVTLVFLVCPGLPKFFQLSQPPMTGYLLTVLMSCKGELAFYSGEGTRETSTTFHEGSYKI